MLIRNMDDNLVVNGNPFYETLKRNSEVFKETLEFNKKSRRGTGKTSTRPMTSLSKYNSHKNINFANIPTIITNSKNHNRSTDFGIDGALTGRLDEKEVDNIINFCNI